MVNAGKKFFNVAFKYPAGSGIILTSPKSNQTKSIQCLVSAPADAAGKRIGDKCLVKKRVKSAVNGAMKQSIPHARFMNVPGFWVLNAKRLIAVMFIDMIN